MLVLAMAGCGGSETAGGTVTTCYMITTVGAPSNHAVGGFCPTNVSDGSAAGMWIEGGKT